MTIIDLMLCLAKAEELEAEAKQQDSAVAEAIEIINDTN